METTHDSAATIDIGISASERAAIAKGLSAAGSGWQAQSRC